LSKFILWWCIPPALPRPPGCLRCFPKISKHNLSFFLKIQNWSCLPIRPWPWLTCPRSFLVFFLLLRDCKEIILLLQGLK
jgi:hypothetical protein